jgi:propanol-preferring alcohol dehydrogenase
VGNRKEAMEILDLAKRGLVKTAIRKEKMENISSVFRDMKAGTLQGRVVIEIAPES